MSIQKEVEKMYRQDEERKKKNEKKKKNGRRATLVVLILIVILALLLAKALGLFGGNGLGFGKSGSSDDSGKTSADKVSVVSEAGEDSSEPEIPRVYDDIKVSGSTYLYKGSEISLDDLMDTFSMEKMNQDVVARILDDNATQNAMEQLTEAFDGIGREYTIERAETENSRLSEESAG